MIDLHSHVLPGVDDGPQSIEGSLEILRAAAEDGIERIAATPHVRRDYPTTPETMERRVLEVNHAARAAGIGVEVLPGGELDLTFAHSLDDELLSRFGLGGNPRLLLLEFPYYGWPLELPQFVFGLKLRGFSVVLAHPERNAAVKADPERLRPLVQGGAVVQITAAAIDGRSGAAAATLAKRLVEGGLAHLLASDSHETRVRAIGLKAAVEALGGGALGRWLTVDVPAALIAGERLPSRPVPRRREFAFFRSRD